MPRAVLAGTAGSAAPAVPPTQSTRLGGRRRRFHRGTGFGDDAVRVGGSGGERPGTGGPDRGPDPSPRCATRRAVRAVRPGPDPRAATRAAGEPDAGADRPDQDTGR